jgi:antitoxin VapB
MDLFIKNAITESKIRKLAERTGESLTQAVERAVDERLARTESAPAGGSVDRAKLAKVFAYFDSLPHINEHLTDDEIIGYDENGIPK